MILRPTLKNYQDDWLGLGPYHLVVSNNCTYKAILRYTAKLKNYTALRFLKALQLT